MRKIIAIMFLIGAFFPAGRVCAEETLTWRDCVAEAQKNNPQLISAVEGVNQAAADKAITASGLLPQVDSGISAAREKANKKISETYGYDVSGSQLLFDGLKTINNVRSAAEDIKASQHNYKFVSSGVRYNLRAAFISLLRAQELLDITRQIYDIRRNNFELINLRYESGIEHRGALLTSEADLIQAEYEITQAKRALEADQTALLKAMGRKEITPVEVSGAFELAAQPAEKPDFEKIADTNPSFAKLIAQKAAAYFGLQAAYGDFWPEVSAQAGAGRTDTKWPPKKGLWDTGLSVSLPIFEGGSRLAEVNKARSLLNQTEADARNSRDTIITALQETWQQLLDAADMVNVQRKYLEAAQERVNIAEAQYVTGYITYDNWTIIEDNLVSAKKSYLDARANALLAEAQWIQAKGDTLEYAE